MKLPNLYYPPRNGCCAIKKQPAKIKNKIKDDCEIFPLLAYPEMPNGRMSGIEYNYMKNRVLRGREKFTIILSVLLSIGIIYSSSTIWTAQAAGTISGRVFQDFNGNGNYDTTLTITNNGFGTTGAAIDRGVAAVTVTAYNSSGTASGSATTDANGLYSIATTGTGPYRVEFTTIPTGFLPSARNTDSVDGGTAANSGSTVQFVSPTAGTPVTNVNLAVNYPADYSQNNPEVLASLYMSGDQGTITSPVLVSFPYSAGSTDATTGATESAFDQPGTILGVSGQNIGTTYGLAYARKSRLIYAGAFFKRHAGFGPGGPNRIYVINRVGNGNVITPNIIVPGTATNAHDTTNYPRDNGNTGWDAVGKTSLGGMALSEDESVLYVNNLANRTLYALNPTTGATIASNATLPTMPVNTGNCANNDRRPFALSVYRGILYAGFVCSGESVATVDTYTDSNSNGQYDAGDYYIESNGTAGRQTGESYLDLNGNGSYDAGETFVDNDGNGFYNTGDARKLYAYVFTVNPTTLAYSASPVFSMPLNYRRGITTHTTGSFGFWRPWSTTFQQGSTTSQTRPSYAQPMLTDIAFDNGNLILGLRDRISDQVGNGSLSNPNDLDNTSLYQPRTAGDIIRACGSVGSWTLESNGRCGGTGTAPQNTSEGPGGGEFYFGDSYDVSDNYLTPNITVLGKGGNHDDTASGGVEQLPGAPDAMFTNFDPIPNIANMTHDGGIRWNNNTTGNFAKAYRLFDGTGNDAGVFGKAGGIGGSLVIMPDPAPLSLGNRVWRDTDGDGIQDPGENGIATITVRLYQGSTLIGTAVTDTNGEYYFSSATGTNTANAIYGLNILPNTSYQIRMDNAVNYSTGNLSGLLLTRRDETTQAGFDEASDSDASLVTNPAGSAAGTFAVIPVTTGDYGDNNHNLDAGFASSTTYSLGNRVWFDTNNDGMINAGEFGISGVSLTLLDSANNPVDNPNITGTQDYTITSDANGYYRFDTLAAGNYKVRVNASNFTGTLLAGYQNTTGNIAADLDSTSVSGQNGEDGINPTVANTVRTNGILSNLIALGAPGEPTGEADLAAAGQGAIDAAANMTVDFGFYRACLGGTIWSDTNNNGLLGSGETGLGSVKVQIYSGTTEILVGADGILGTADDGANGMLTSSVSGSIGNYNFCGLSAGTYRVVVTPNGGTSSTDIATTANPDNNVDSDDNGFPDNTGSFTGKTISGLVTVTPGNTGALGNKTVTNSNGTTADPTVDFGFNLAPSVVRLDKFEAFTDGSGGVRLEWATGGESKNLGFNVYRESNGRRELVNSTMIAGSAIRSSIELQASGDNYGWTDNSFYSVNAAYWLEDIDLDGTKTLHGPVTPSFKISFGKAAPNAKLLTDLINPARSSNEKVFVGENASEFAQTQGSIERQREIAALGGVKISVRHDGWYRVTAEQLQNAGFDVNSSRDLWQLFVGAEEIPIQIYTDGSIEFFGRGLDTISSDTQVYYLVREKSAGRRISTSKEAVSDEQQPTVSSFPVTIERKDRINYISSALNGDAENWFGDLVFKTVETEQSLNVRGLVQEGQIHLSLKLQALTDTAHLVNLRFNNFQLGTVSYDGAGNQTFEFDLPLSAVNEGANKLYLQSAGTGNDISMVDTIRLSYRRDFKASDDKLRFTIPAGELVQVGGFSTGKINFFEVKSGTVSNIIETQYDLINGSYTFTFAPGNADREILALAGSIYESPAAVERNNPSNLSSRLNSADFVIITPEIFRNQADQLANIRQSQGLRTKVVFIEDIFDENSFGSNSPEAVRQFLQMTQENWRIKPRFALLFGDSSFDPRGFSGQTNRNFVPSKLIDTESMETTSDAWLADFDGDGIEDIALGRLPAGNSAEAVLMLGKLARYAAQTPRTVQTDVLVSDRGFEGFTNYLQAQLPNGVQFSRINRSAMTDGEMNQAIITQANESPTVLTYNGHGTTGLWAGSGVFSSPSASALTNEKLSFVMLLTCLNGYTGNAYADTIAEAFFKAENGGAYAVWASSGVTRPDAQLEIGSSATAAFFASGNNVRLGDILRNAKQNTTNKDVRLTWSLIGDPTVFVK